MPISFSDKVKQLPEPVKNMLLSNQPAEEIYKATTSYGIPAEGRGNIAELVGLIFVKDLPLEKFAEAIQKIINVPEPIAAGIATHLTKSLFFPLSQYFPQGGNLVQNWSQKAAPPTHPAQSLNLPKESVGEKTEISEPEEPVQKDIFSAIRENEKVADQTITSSPIKLADSEMLKLPSIKNWLLDYKKYKAGFPDQDPMLVRVRFLHESPNTKNLNEAERNILSQMLKSYDEKIKLPFSKKTGLLITGIAPQSLPQFRPQPKPQPQSPKIVLSPPPPKTTPPLSQSSPAFTPPRPQTAQPAASYPPLSSSPQKDSFREQIEPKDLAGPQAPQKPEPKLNGNIVNLKELGSK